MALLLAAGLVLGFLLFTATARWSVFAVRYEIPQFVAWSPVIAVALSTLPKMVVRVVLVLLLIACTPQLFQNVEEPFIHQDFAANSLVPYFLDTNLQNYALRARRESTKQHLLPSLRPRAIAWPSPTGSWRSIRSGWG